MLNISTDHGRVLFDVGEQDYFAAGHSADQFRMICVQQHYRASINYSPALLATAADAIRMLQHVFSSVRNAVANVIYALFVSQLSLS